MKTRRNKILRLSLLGFSIAIAGACGGSDGNSNGSDASGVTIACIDNQRPQAEQGACTRCPEGEFPNSEHTACVTSCKEGEIKPMNKPTCELKLSCIAPQIHNPADNTCMDCPEGQFPNSELSACVSSCKEGEIKPANKAHLRG